MKRIIFFSLLAAAVVLAPTLLASDALAGGSKGLRVFLTINTNLVSQPVEIDTYQFDQFVAMHNSYIDNGITEIELNYEPGEVVNEEFELCAYPMNTELEQCAFGYNTEEKEPVYVTVDVYGSYAPQPVDQQNQNENQNNNANGQSQEQKTQIYICNDGKCLEQK